MFRFKSQAKKERLRVVYVLDGNDIEDEIEIDMDISKVTNEEAYTVKARQCDMSMVAEEFFKVFCF
jgi:predicted alpha/beta superfamily hydrolase